MNKQINTEKAPAAIGPYSQAVEANGMVFASGQLPIDPATGAFAEGGVKEQTRQSLTNAKHILEEAGTDLQHVVKTTVFLSDRLRCHERGLRRVLLSAVPGSLCSCSEDSAEERSGRGGVHRC